MGPSYADLPKIPVRAQHIVSDMAALSTQFSRTMVILQHHLFQRVFRPSQSSQQLQDFQIVHLHINPKISIHQMYSSSIHTSIFDRTNVPIIFPVRKGIWELVVRNSSLDQLRQSPIFGFPEKVWFEEMDVLPIGMAARVAQVHCRPPFVLDRSIARIYVAMLRKYPFHHVMKDIAESFAIQEPEGAIIDGWFCLFGASGRITAFRDKGQRSFFSKDGLPKEQSNCDF